MNRPLGFVLPLVKIDEERRQIVARAAQETPDRAREIMDYETAKPEFQKWSDEFSAATNGLSKGNVRAMHNPKQASGKVEEIRYNDDEKAIDVLIKVVDDQDWKKVMEGVYTGLSVGGGYKKSWQDPTGLRRYTPSVGELSLVDRPCIPTALFAELHKADGSTAQVRLTGTLPSFAERWATRPISYAERRAEDLAKGVFDHTKQGASVGYHVGMFAGGIGAALPAAAVGGAAGLAADAVHDTGKLAVGAAKLAGHGVAAGARAVGRGVSAAYHTVCPHCGQDMPNLIKADDFDPEKHPRDHDGKFATKSGGSSEITTSAYEPVLVHLDGHGPILLHQEDMDGGRWYNIKRGAKIGMIIGGTLGGFKGGGPGAIAGIAAGSALGGLVGALRRTPKVTILQSADEPRRVAAT